MLFHIIIMCACFKKKLKPKIKWKNGKISTFIDKLIRNGMTMIIIIEYFFRVYVCCILEELYVIEHTLYIHYNLCTSRKQIVVCSTEEKHHHHCRRRRCRCQQQSTTSECSYKKSSNKDRKGI